MKIVTRQQCLEGNLPRYFTGRPCKYGHICERWRDGHCIECHRRDQKVTYLKETEAQRLNRRVMSRDWKIRNPETARAHSNNYNRIRRELIGGQRIALLHAKETTQIYKDCPEGMEVDHEVPLRGRNVCGLHVPWNLQYLTPEANREKSNGYA